MPPLLQELPDLTADAGKLLAGVITVCLLLGQALALADTTAGKGPDDALAPSDERTPLTKGERH